MNPRDLARTALLAAVLGGTPLAAASAAIPAALAGMRVPSLAPMIRKVSPAVVTIAIRGVMPDSDADAQHDDPFDNRFFHDSRTELR